MGALIIVRASPPEISRCRAPACQRLVEWVTTAKNGKRMPVDHPLRALATSQDLIDDRTLTTIDTASSHFATCVAAPQFSKRGRHGHR